VDTRNKEIFRVAPAPGLREKAIAEISSETERYTAQLTAYQHLADEEMFTIRPVTLKKSLEALLSRPGMRVNCANCGEEIMNEREILQNGENLCLPCAQGGYYLEDKTKR